MESRIIVNPSEVAQAVLAAAKDPSRDAMATARDMLGLDPRCGAASVAGSIAEVLGAVATDPVARVEIDRTEETMLRMDADADGVPVFPGDHVYSLDGDTEGFDVAAVAPGAVYEFVGESDEAKRHLPEDVSHRPQADWAGLRHEAGDGAGLIDRARELADREAARAAAEANPLGWAVGMPGSFTADDGTEVEFECAGSAIIDGVSVVIIQAPDGQYFQVPADSARHIGALSEPETEEAGPADMPADVLPDGMPADVIPADMPVDAVME